MQESVELVLNNLFVEAKTKNGISESTKLISYDQLKGLFEQRQSLDTGMLPGEYGVQRYVESNGVKYILYTEPARVLKVRHEHGSAPRPRERDFDDTSDYEEAMSEYRESSTDGHVYDFASPILCWMVRVERSSVKTLLYAMKSTIITGLEPLYSAPFPNIYDGSSLVCWGDNQISIPTPKAIQGLSTIFFSAPANSDLTHERFVSYQRVNFPGEAFYPIHLHMDIDKMLESETPEKTLEFVKDILLDEDMSVMSRFNQMIEGINI